MYDSKEKPNELRNKKNKSNNKYDSKHWHTLNVCFMKPSYTYEYIIVTQQMNSKYAEETCYTLSNKHTPIDKILRC